MSPDQSQTMKTLLADLAARLKKAAPDDEPPAPAVEHGEPLVDELLRGLLQWEATHAQARTAYEKILAAIVDYNELRVMLPHEIVGVLGPRFPRAEERAERIRAVLNDVFDREHALTLEHLRDMPKREARVYVESLTGITRFAIGRLMLLGLGAHAFPLDERLMTRLVAAGAVSDEGGVDGAAGRLERALRSGESREAYELIELWSEEAPAEKPKAARGGKRAAARSKA